MKIIADGIIIKDNKILLVQEGKDHCRGQWNTPAGKIELNENLIDCVKREVKEEAGLKIQVDSLLGIYTYYSQRGTHLGRFSFNCTTNESNLKVDNKEILGAKWVDFSDINKLELRDPEVMNKIIEDAKNKKKYPLEIITNLLDNTKAD